MLYDTKIRIMADFPDNLTVGEMEQLIKEKYGKEVKLAGFSKIEREKEKKVREFYTITALNRDNK